MNAEGLLQMLDKAVPRGGGKPSLLPVRQALGTVTGVDPGHINLKTISAGNQVSPRTSESRANRFRAGSPPTWIFGALVTAPTGQRGAVIDATKREAVGFASVALIFVRDEHWRLDECLYDPSHTAIASELRRWFGLPSDRVSEFTGQPAHTAPSIRGGRLLVISDVELQAILERAVASALAEIRTAATSIEVDPYGRPTPGQASSS